jgi:hypothetical protein
MAAPKPEHLADSTLGVVRAVAPVGVETSGAQPMIMVDDGIKSNRDVDQLLGV